jgi:membrane dipeptidase
MIIFIIAEMDKITSTPARKFISGIEILLILIIVSLTSCKSRHIKSDEEFRQMAQKICERNIILDSHIDWPEFILDDPENISEQTDRGDFDLVRARKGGLDAALSVVYISSAYDVEKGRIMVDSMLKLINYYASTYPDKFALALTPADVKKNFESKRFSFIPCLENGSPVGDDLGYLKYLKDSGIAYITLCHSRNNQISDSNFDKDRKWNGLSPEGKEIIKQLNRLGIMIDISHSSDSTVAQAVRLSEVPIIASHSSCRYFVPDLERDLPDDLIKAIAKKGGVVMVNFCTEFLDSVCSRNTDEVLKLLDSKKLRYESKEGLELISEFAKTHRLTTDSKQLANHIEHLIKIAGIDHVGIGSDFDGIGPLKPTDIPDVSGYPVIVAELLRRGYPERDIIKILSGNFLRVWSAVIKAGEASGK